MTAEWAPYSHLYVVLNEQGEFDKLDLTIPTTEASAFLAALAKPDAWVPMVVFQDLAGTVIGIKVDTIAYFELRDGSTPQPS